jgi:hypothetical protein
MTALVLSLLISAGLVDCGISTSPWTNPVAVAACE